MRRTPDKQRQKVREAFIEAYFALINGEMERQGVRRSALAERMGCAPANVTQILKQTGNLTAASMVDLAYHLGVKLHLVFLPTLVEGRDMDGKVIIAERNIFSPHKTRRLTPEWEPKKKSKNLMKLGA